VHRGLVGCPIVLQVVGQVWGVNGWRQFQVCLVCQRKAGGDAGGDMVAGGKPVGYIWDLYVQAFHACLFCLQAADREREGYVLFEVG